MNTCEKKERLGRNGSCDGYSGSFTQVSIKLNDLSVSDFGGNKPRMMETKMS